MIGCPCVYTTPCHTNCTCVRGGSSQGCARCCSYGSAQQQRAMAEHLAAVIDASEWIAVADRQPEPWDAEVLCWDAADQAHLPAHISGYREKGRVGPIWVADVEGQIFEPQQVTHWMPLPPAPRTGERR